MESAIWAILAAALAVVVCFRKMASLPAFEVACLSHVERILRHGINDQVDDIVLGNHAVQERLLRGGGRLWLGCLRAEVKNR